MALPLPDPTVGGRAAKSLVGLSESERVQELERRLESIQRNFDKLAAQYPAGIGEQYQPQVPQARVSVGSIAANDVTSSVTLALTFDTVEYELPADVDQWASGTPKRLTCVVPGLYDIDAYIVWPSEGGGGGMPAGGIWAQWINHNSAGALARVDLTRQDNAQAIQPIQTVSTQYRLAAGEYVELHAFQNSGAGRRVSAATLAWHWVSP